MQKYSIGIDIGGTNTDAVLIDETKKILASCKKTTTDPVEGAVVDCIKYLLQKAQVPSSSLSAICVGTTHATNAILEAKNLLPTGLIRIAGHKPDMPSGFGWDTNLRSHIVGTKTIPGGFECDGSLITPFSTKIAKQAVLDLLRKGAQAVSIVGCFSPVNNTQEKEVEQLILGMMGKDFPVTCSSDIGGLGFLERENAALINSFLKKGMRDSFHSLKQALIDFHIQAPLFIVNNNGSLMTLEEAIQFPLFTVAAGPTNSIIGASKLSGRSSSIVVDIGGTSTDIGLAEHFSPKRSTKAKEIGSVHLQFAMPDLISLSIGGGSIIGSSSVGPQSIARRLKKEALSFGGDTLCLTDVAVSCGIFSVEGAKKIPLSQETIDAVINNIQSRLHRSLQVMLGKRKELPIIAVGGTAPLIKHLFPEVILPLHYDVANAYGAALAEVSSTVDIVTSLQKRIEVLESLKEKASSEAILKGADPKTTRITNVELIPFPYSEDSLHRVVITAAGPRSER